MRRLGRRRIVRLNGAFYRVICKRSVVNLYSGIMMDMPARGIVHHAFIVHVNHARHVIIGKAIGDRLTAEGEGKRRRHYAKQIRQGNQPPQSLPLRFGRPYQHKYDSTFRDRLSDDENHSRESSRRQAGTNRCHSRRLGG